jgi:hypothetical protein
METFIPLGPCIVPDCSDIAALVVKLELLEKVSCWETPPPSSDGSL